MADKVYFDVEEVTNSMNNLENKFTLFANTLEEINSYIETEIDAGPDSAIFGEYGSKLLQIWSANAATFGDFHANFESWSEAVAVISANNSDFTVETAALYRDNGNTMTGIGNARSYLKDSSQSLSAEGKNVLNAAAKAKSAKTIDDNNAFGGKTIQYTDNENNTITMVYDKDGNLVYYSKGDENNQNLKYYDGNSKELTAKPTVESYEKEMKENSDKLKENLKEFNEKNAAKKGNGNTQASEFFELGDRAYNSDPEAIKEWIEKVGEIVKNTNTYGMKKSLIIAQIINESGWMCTPKSKNADGSTLTGNNNILGINYDMGKPISSQDSAWSKDPKHTQSNVTQWSSDGSHIIGTSEAMRTYNSIEDCIEDYANVMYLYHPECAGNNNIEAYRGFLEGYTPNPNGSTTDKYKSIISRYNLEIYDT